MLLLLPLSVLADEVRVKVAAGAWNSDPEGTVRDTRNGTDRDVNVVEELGFTDSTNGQAYVLIEHPIPILPNFRVGATLLGYDGTGTIKETVTYAGQTFQANERVQSELTLDHYDLLLYWQVLDNVVDLDLGLNIRYYDGQARIESLDNPGVIGEESIGLPVPMLYGNLAVSLPLGFWIGADANVISYDGSRIGDYTAKFGYSSDYLIGVEAGYRYQQVKLDEVDDVFADLKFKGPFVNLYLDF
ncbi:MAG: TIGR04219 family outer membrane beta-barrel protein [Pseudomonadota bacterium]|nr:MAG: TIGR04219 family outer membrane beta-barrel protein [Pseudomonadota bacterium]